MTESRLAVTWGLEEDAKGHKETFMVVGDGYVFYLDCVMASLVHTHVKTYQMAHFKYVPFVIFQS